MDLNRAIISMMHTVASENPELLKVVMTDQVLIWTIKDLDQKLKEEYEKYITYKNLSLSQFENKSQKEMNEELVKITGRTLLSYYKLYKIFEELKDARNISIELETDINLILELLKEEKLYDQNTLNRTLKSPHASNE